MQMKGHGAKFGRKKEEAIAALLIHRNIDEAARSVGIAPSTLLRWMKETGFDTELPSGQAGGVRPIHARLQQGTSAAATTLLKIMIDPNAPASVRVRAADSVLDHATKAIEIEEIEARVAALEQAASGASHHR